jgi:hypothetical protein
MRWLLWAPILLCGLTAAFAQPMAWDSLGMGIRYAEVPLTLPSVLGESRLQILEINPNLRKLELFCAGEAGHGPLTANEWAEKEQLQVVFNAGMYRLDRPMVSRGFLRTKTYINQDKWHPDYKGLLLLQPQDSALPSASVCDMTCPELPDWKEKYSALVQGLRMLDCQGAPLSWDKKKQSCSMMVLGKNAAGNLYLVFCRSPYTHNQMIAFLRNLPLGLRETVYLEGGPETSLLVRMGNFRLECRGSFVSDTYENDANQRFWELPNVIGIR